MERHDWGPENEPGWFPLAVPDGRRGVWMRVTPDAVELCAGRWGEDSLVTFRRGDVVSDRQLAQAQAILGDYAFALGQAHAAALMAAKSKEPSDG